MDKYLYREVLGTSWYIEAHADMDEAKMCCPKGWNVELFKENNADVRVLEALRNNPGQNVSF